MANFNEAYKITMQNEGGYSNDSTDAGGETYKGISRKYNPSWKGWKLIDQLKSQQSFPLVLDGLETLQDLVEDFYKDHYWDVNRLDEYTSQKVANEMFDTGVNLGVSRAANFLQQSLNYLNRNGSVFRDLVVDGKIGPATLKALDMVVYKDEEVLLKIMNVLQGMHYLNYMKQSPAQEKYCRGWFSRMSISK